VECSSILPQSQPMSLIPSREELDKLLDTLSPDALHPSLAVDDFLVPISPAPHTPPPPYDFAGLSSYARIAAVLVQLLTNDRQLAKAQPWALRHVLALAQLAHDWLQLPGAASPAFAPGAKPLQARELATRAQHVLSYVLGGTHEPAWHAAVVAAAGGKGGVPADAVGRFVVDEVRHAAQTDAVRDARMLRTMLDYVVREVEVKEADLWMGLARTIEKQGQVLRTQSLCAAS
jgi:hypothetical protein